MYSKKKSMAILMIFETYIRYLWNYGKYLESLRGHKLQNGEPQDHHFKFTLDILELMMNSKNNFGNPDVDTSIKVMVIKNLILMKT